MDVFVRLVSSQHDIIVYLFSALPFSTVHARIRMVLGICWYPEIPDNTMPYDFSTSFLITNRSSNQKNQSQPVEMINGNPNEIDNKYSLHFFPPSVIPLFAS